MSDAPERVWRTVANTPGYSTARYSETKPDFGAMIMALHPNIETVEYIRADIHPARCVGEDGIDHQSYTEAALEEAQVVTDLRAENARLREENAALRAGLARIGLKAVDMLERQLGRLET